MQSITTWTFESDEPLALTRYFAHLEGTVLLHSGGKHDSARSSFLCLFPHKKIIVQAHKNCWEELREKIGEFDLTLSPLPAWVGYIGYEMGYFADPAACIPYYKPSTPDCCFYAPSIVIHFDHLQQLATLYTKKIAPLNHIEESPKKVLFDSFADIDKPKITHSDTVESYLDKIAMIKAWIENGEVYQVNLSHETQILNSSIAPFEMFERVVRINPSAFSAYLQCSDFAIVSSSPERFLLKRKERIETRPIKGTAPRGKTPGEDRLNCEKLMNSEKEKAELLMITDLMRSDLGRVARPGSVVVTEIARCEAYTNVFHLLSIIEAKVKITQHPLEIIRPLFPGGSVTGCPKLRAMEAIAKLEKRARGIYTGSIGYFAANGDFDFNIAIRTSIVHPGCVQIQLGGGVVIDSDPMKEYEETLHKGRSLFSILGNDVL